MPRQEFTTYINALMDAKVESTFNQMENIAGRSFGNIRKSAEQALSGVDTQIGRFKNSFDQVTRTLSSLSSTGLTPLSGIDFNVSGLRQAAAESRLYEEALRGTLRTATLVKLENQDNSKATRDYISALDASLQAAQRVTREAEEQVQIYTRLQDATDQTASRTSRLTQAYRDLFTEQAKSARYGDGDSKYANDFQAGINATRGIGQKATDNGAGFSALAEQAQRQDRLVDELNAGVAELERRFEQEARKAVAEQERVTQALERRREEQRRVNEEASATRLNGATQANNALIAPGATRSATDGGATIAALLAQAEEYDRLARAEAAAANSSQMLSAIYRGTALEQGRTAKSAQDMAIAYRELEQAEERAAQESRDMAAAADRLRGQMDPLFAATSRYNAELAELERVSKGTVLAEGELARMQDFLAKRFEEAKREANEAGLGIKGYGQSLRGQRTAMVQTGQQLQDIAISLQGGQRATTVFAQQLPQLAYALQDVGGKVGKVATTLAGPWGLAFVGAIALSGVLIERLFGLGDAHESAADSAKKEEAAIKSLVEEMDKATQTSAQLARQKYTEAEAHRASAGEKLREAKATLAGYAATLLANTNGGTAGGGGNILAASQAAAAEDRIAKLDKQLAELSGAAVQARGVYFETVAKQMQTAEGRTNAYYDKQKSSAQRSIKDADAQAAAILRIENNRTAALKKISDGKKSDRKAASEAEREAKAAAAQAEREAEAAAKRSLAEKRDLEELALLRKAATENMSTDKLDAALVDINRRYSEQLILLDATTSAGEKGIQTELQLFRTRSQEGKKAEEQLTNILMGYRDMEPVARKAAKEIEKIYAMIGKPMGASGSIFTAEQAQDAEKGIVDGLQRPYREFLSEVQRGNTITMLQASGFESVAQALERALDLQKQGSAIGTAEFQNILDQVRAQESLNDRARVYQEINRDILNIANDTRAATNDLLVGIARGNYKDALKNFGNSIINNVLRQQANQITAKLFAGANDKLRGLLDDSEGVRAAVDILEENAKKSGTTIATFDTTVTQATTALTRLVESLNGAAGDIEGNGAGSAGAPGSLAKEVSNGLTSAVTSLTSTVAPNITTASGEIRNPYIMNAPDLPSNIVAGSQESIDFVSRSMMPPLQEVAKAAQTMADSTAPEAGAQINVTARKTAEVTGDVIAKKSGLSTGKGFAASFESVGSKIDETFGTGKLFSGIGKAVGGALQGAGEGMAASGFARSLGIKQSSTGAAIGGAIGSAIPIPGASAVLGLIGGTIGGMLKKPKFGTASVVLDEFGDYTGSLTGGKGKAQKKAANSAASNVGDILNQVRDALGLEFESVPNITIGTYKDSFRVSDTGRTGKLKGKYSDVTDFGKDGGEEAVAYAAQLMIEGAVITGISQASVNILKSGQDLEKAISKASIIESIPKRLMAIQNPTRYAVEELNDEFEKVISYLKEGSATAEQFADAQKLYDLERASAIEEATSAASSALRDFMAEMQGGTSSPLSRRTVYSNADRAFSELESKIARGETVAEDKLLTAAQNLQAASQGLNGSNSSFFSDFDRIYNTIERAASMLEAGATSSGSTDLPASPFATDTQVAETIAAIGKTQVAATESQTSILADKLDAIANQLGRLGIGTGGSEDTSAFSYLQNF